MADNRFPVNSAPSLDAFVSKVYELYGSGNYIIFSWKTGKTSSMGQKALVHIWWRKYCAHIFKKREKDVSDTEIDSMKRSTKTHFYNETHEPWMVETISDPFHPDKKRLEVTSTKDWTPAQCYHFMTWLQDHAMHNDLILESIGEHQKMTQSQTQ